MAQFLERFGAPPALSYELFGDEVLRHANLVSFGRSQVPTFDLAGTRYVISFGADFLGTWGSPVSQNAAYGRMRQGRPGIRARFVQFEPRMSQTGANADEWVSVKPGTEGVVALGLAHALIAGRLRPADAAGRAGTAIEGWSAGLADYTPAQVERSTGVAAARIERLARELADQRPAVAIIGGAPLAHTNGLFAALAVNALNALLGSVGQPGGLSFMPQIAASAGRQPRADERRTLSKMAADILAADRPAVQALLIDDANPVFTTPPAWRVREALLKVPFIASFGSFIDETTVLADLILPDHSFLESWTEGRPESGAATAVVTLAPPAMRPLHQTRAMPDVVLQVAASLARPLNPPLPWKTFDEMLMAAFSTLPPASASADAWTAAQQQGGWWGEVGSCRRQQPARETPIAVGTVCKPSRSRTRNRSSTARSARIRSTSCLTLRRRFSTVHSRIFPGCRNCRTSCRRRCGAAGWRSIRRPRRGSGSPKVTSSRSRRCMARCSAPALVSPGMAPDVIAMPVGQGHETFTRYASGRGENPIRILAPLTEPETGALAWAATRVRLSRVSGPTGELILFAGGTSDPTRRSEIAVRSRCDAREGLRRWHIDGAWRSTLTAARAARRA